MSSKLSLVVARIASLKPLVLAGVLAAGAVVSIGTANANAADPLESARLGTELINADADAGNAVNDLMRANLKTIATTSFSTLSPKGAAMAIRDMASQSLKYSGRIPRETTTGRSVENLALQEGMSRADRYLGSARSRANLFSAKFYVGDDETLKVAIDRVSADYKSTRAGLEGALLSKELKRLIADVHAPAVLLQKAARRALLKDGVLIDELAEVRIDPVTEFERSADTRLETLAEICDRIDFFEKGPTKDDKDDATALRAELADTALSGIVERRAAERVALEAIAEMTIANGSPAVDIDRLASAIKRTDAAEMALENTMDDLKSGRPLHEIAKFAGDRAKQISQLDHEVTVVAARP
jgi:hypothetical protein